MAQFCAVFAQATEPLRPRIPVKSVLDAGLSLFDRTVREKVRAKITALFQELKVSGKKGLIPFITAGDPDPLTGAIGVAKEILANNKPLFGICLGHQVIALANGVSTYKMFNGHRGINHPVKNVITGKGEITSQNHGFAVNKEELENHPDLEITHLHLNDGTVAGMRMKNKNCFSVQYHPEASPGPHDSSYLFDQFIENMKK